MIQTEVHPNNPQSRNLWERGGMTWFGRSLHKGPIPDANALRSELDRLIFSRTVSCAHQPIAANESQHRNSAMRAQILAEVFSVASKIHDLEINACPCQSCLYIRFMPEAWLVDVGKQHYSFAPEMFSVLDALRVSTHLS